MEQPHPLTPPSTGILTQPGVENMNKFIYLHRDPVTEEPKYIGRGGYWRAFSFSKKSKYYEKWLITLGGKTPIVEILEKGLSLEESYEREKIWISVFKPCWTLLNRCPGGASNKGVKFNEDFVEYKRDAMLGNKNPMFGKTHTEETCKKISERLKGSTGWNKGKRGLTKNPNRKPIICNETGGVFPSIYEASIQLKTSKSNIRSTIKTPGRTTKGFSFRFLDAAWG